MTIKELKKLSKEDFLKLPNTTEKLYSDLSNSKSGYIDVVRTKDGLIWSGYTDAFGEGLSLIINKTFDFWQTSNVKEINWKEGYFDTLNSRYIFTFEEEDNDSTSY